MTNIKEENKIEEIKEDIEKKLESLVNYINKDYASPRKEILLEEINKKLQSYLEKADDKNLQILLLLNEFISGILTGFSNRV